VGSTCKVRASTSRPGPNPPGAWQADKAHLAETAAADCTRIELARFNIMANDE
jgi:hypothetical protein